jgi:energy-coupling factor transporter ATP-binding protein EcfA2
MHINHLFIPKYYHLDNFKCDFKKPISVFIGENGSGKSRVLEAIIEIFRNLHYTESLPIPFPYLIQYEIAGTKIEISTLNDKYEIKIDGQPKEMAEILQVSKSWVYKKIPEKLEGILPDNIFLYYSGQSDRIVKHFSKIEDDYQNGLKDGYDMGLKPLFLFNPMHGKIILLGLLASKLEGIKSFLLDNFSIVHIDSFEIRLKRPKWSGSSKANSENFWNAQKIVREYLSDLKMYSHNEIKLTNDRVALQFPAENLDSLINLPYIGYESKLVKILDSLNTADFIEDVIVNFKTKDGKIINFESLSEGEQQLIAIKGITELLRGEETLYLLDEPDNYLHPSWQENLLEDLAEYKQKTHFLITTHSPQLLTNANPEYSELFVLYKGKLRENIPNYFGKDVNSILYSLMNSSYRNEEVTEKLDRLFKAIALQKLEEAEPLYSELLAILGTDDPKLVSAKSEIDFIKFDGDEVNSEK